MTLLETESQHVDQTPLDQSADLHATPQGRYAITKGPTLLQPTLHGAVGMGAVVIRDSQLGEAQGRSLFNQRNGFEAAVTADGVAMKVERTWTAIGCHLNQHLAQRMPHLKASTLLQPADVSNGHKTGWSRP